MPHTKTLDIQGHRGARGLYPENTITGFIEAVKLGVHTLEMDVVISKDSQVVVSHEAWMNDSICTKPNGEKVETNAKELYNLFKMNYSEIRLFDCGKKGHPDFPTQKALPEHKPLLSEVIKQVDAYIKKNNLPEIIYNIEFKSDPADDGIYNPDPEIFVDLLYRELMSNAVFTRMILQSFDVRILQALYRKDPKIRMSLLIENTDSLEHNLQQLGFMPAIYGPDFNLITEQLILDLRKYNIQLIPWTVNEVADMKKLIAMGVDGIITDYPDRLINLVNNKI